MSRPVWITKSSDLGTIPEVKYFEIPLRAVDSDDALKPVLFELVAGQLPAGLSLDGYGNLLGNPETVVKVIGVPSNVGESVTSKFAVRARSAEYYINLVSDGSTTEYLLPAEINFNVYRLLITVDGQPRNGYFVQNGNQVLVTLSRVLPEDENITIALYSLDSSVSDRTFTVTVVGQNPPQILTFDPLGTFVDGDYVDIDISALDLDGDDLTWSVTDGALPPGLTINTSTGKISGYIFPLGTPTQPASQIVTVFTFTVTVSDGKDTDAENYNLRVIASSLLATSITELSADDLSVVTGDRTNVLSPIILNTGGEIGPVTHDNFFLYKFNALDFAGDAIDFVTDFGTGAGFDDDIFGFDAAPFSESTGTGLPPGLTLDPNTGWLYGYLPFQSDISITYEFYVRARKTSVFYTSPDGSTVLEYLSRRIPFRLTVLGEEQSTLTWVSNENLGSIDNGAVSELQIKAVVDPEVELYYEILSGSYSKLPPGVKLLSNGLLVGRATFSTFSLDGGTTTFDKNSFFIDNETTFDNQYRFTVRVYSDSEIVNATKEFYITVNRVSDRPYENLYFESRLDINQRQQLENLLSNEDYISDSDLYRKEDLNFGKTDNLRLLVANGVNPAPASDYVAAMRSAHYFKSLYFGDIKTAQVLNRDGSLRYEVVYIEILDQLRNSQGQDVNAEVNITASKVSIDLNTPPYPGGIENVNPNTNTFISVYPNNISRMRRQLNRTLGQVSRRLPDWMTSKQKNGKSLGFTAGCILAYVSPGSAERIAYRLRTSGFNFSALNFIVDQYIWDNAYSSNFDKNTNKFLTDSETTFDVYSLPLVSSPSIYVNDPSSLPNLDENGLPKATTFDGNSLRFVPFRDSYRDPFSGAEYLKFPQRNILR